MRAGAPLNMVASESAAARAAVTELAAQPPAELLSLLERVPSLCMPARHAVGLADVDPGRLHKVLLRTYEQPPEDFASLLGTAGPRAEEPARAGADRRADPRHRASTRDPARFAFAHGGKDGTPLPVDRATYDKTIDVLHKALNRAKVERSERVSAFKRLMAFAGQPRSAPAPELAAAGSEHPTIGP